MRASFYDLRNWLKSANFADISLTNLKSFGYRAFAGHAAGRPFALSIMLDARIQRGTDRGARRGADVSCGVGIRVGQRNSFFLPYACAM